MNCNSVKCSFKLSNLSICLDLLYFCFKFVYESFYVFIPFLLYLCFNGYVLFSLCAFSVLRKLNWISLNWSARWLWVSLCGYLQQKLERSGKGRRCFNHWNLQLLFLLLYYNFEGIWGEVYLLPRTWTITSDFHIICHCNQIAKHHSFTWKCPLFVLFSIKL